MEKQMSKDKTLKLAIACGQNIPEGFVGMDIAPSKGVKFVGDILDFWSKDNVWSKIKDNSVDEIDCTMFVEHIPHIIEGHGMKHGFDDCFYLFFNEIYRVLKPAEFDEKNPNIATKGFAKIVVPYYSSPRADQDPTHVRRLSEASFLYLNQDWLKANKLDHYPTKADFNFSYAYNINGRLQNRNQEFIGIALQTELNAADDLIVTIVKK
jgi:hypothetical protein